LAEASGSKLFYPQSFLIYEGSATPIPEEQPPKPVSHYAELKLEAETHALQNLPGCLSVRMAGFFGGEERDKNFVGKIVPHIHGLIEQGAPSISIGDREWQPTWTEDLARNSILLMGADQSGTMQMACDGVASFYELTVALAEELGFADRIELVEVRESEVNRDELGARPARAELSCTRLDESGLNTQRPWKDALREYLRSSYFDQYRFNG
jgi:dTDP-4-dehydrorhamnose reductase